ncbi:MAG: class I SAM-dependent methyltransferase [Patescibacteria group bacterium]
MIFNGVKIENILQSSRLSLLGLDEKVPFEGWVTCPCCENSLKPVCQLVSGSGKEIRFGLCENCGYMGYMDRPTKDWMNDFYSREWDKSFPKTIAEIKKGTILPGKGIKPSRYLAASLIEEIKPNKEKPVCEIGSGYGEVLKYFRDFGFKNVIGVENSKHRAELVRRVLGFNVLYGGFEDKKIQNELSKQKPIGLIFSHHVLEHTYDPAEVLKKISSLQEEGDYLILALPNVDGEHIDYSLLYLVHLHSFTKESLELLLNKNGYEIIADNSPDNSNMIIAARKTLDPQPKFKVKQNYYDLVSKRIRKGLAIDEMKKTVLYELYWEQGIERDIAEITEIGSDGVLQKVSWYFKNKIAYIRSRFFKRFTAGYTMLVFPIISNYNFEIRFSDKITFLVK